MATTADELDLTDVDAIAGLIRQSLQGCSTHPAGPILTWHRLRDADPELVRSAARKVEDHCREVADDDTQGDPLRRREAMVADFLATMYPA